MKKGLLCILAIVLGLSLFACSDKGKEHAEKAAELVYELVENLSKQDLSEEVYIYEERNDDTHFADYHTMSGKVKSIVVKNAKMYQKAEKITLAIHLEVKTKEGNGTIKVVLESDKKGKSLAEAWKEAGTSQLIASIKDYKKASKESGKYETWGSESLDEEVLEETLNTMLKENPLSFTNVNFVKSDDPSLFGSDVNGPVVCPYPLGEETGKVFIHYDDSHLLNGLVVRMTQNMGFEVDPDSLPAAKEAMLAEFGDAKGISVSVAMDDYDDHVVHFEVHIDLKSYDVMSDPVGLFADMSKEEKELIDDIPVSMLMESFASMGAGACENYYK